MGLSWLLPKREPVGVQPETRYAKSGDVAIAYQVVGDGPFDLVRVPPFVSHVELAWQVPGMAALNRRLASFSRLISFDKRGTGMSDRVSGVPTLEARMDDVRAVMDAAGSERAALLGASEGGPKRYLAEHIPGARLVEVPGTDHSTHSGDTDAVLGEIEEFLTAVWEERAWEDSEPDRVLATVLFTDIVGSTAKAVELGDSRWRELLDAHHTLIRRLLVRYRGKELDTAGDGFFASFDGPARASRCACAISQGLRELGIDVRAGLHTGECELIGEKVGGIAVHVGARVASQAGAGEVLVSSTVKALVAGSVEFVDQGVKPLRDIPGEWRLFAVQRDGA